ncbi:MAG: haloacid dehalogenase type II [Rhodospirillales bacterium]|nr:MAG: haloacid dehalogenase type II [Rhodospirillales bacterium]
MTEATDLTDVGACAFDAYGTLFDVNAAAERCRDALGDKADALAAVWRAKQLEYTWLRSLRGDYVDFWHVTGQSLDYAFASTGIQDDALRARLMELYFILDAYPDVRPALERIRAAGMKTAILSNGAPSMLIAAVRHAGLERLINDIQSVDSVGVYKPHPSTYQLAVDRLKLPAERICFVSANPWDVSGAALFGLRVVWLNRFSRLPECLPGQAECEIRSLDALPSLLGL